MVWRFVSILFLFFASGVITASVLAAATDRPVVKITLSKGQSITATVGGFRWFAFTADARTSIYTVPVQYISADRAAEVVVSTTGAGTARIDWPAGFEGCATVWAAHAKATCEATHDSAFVIASAPDVPKKVQGFQSRDAAVAWLLDTFGDTNAAQLVAGSNALGPAVDGQGCAAALQAATHSATFAGHRFDFANAPDVTLYFRVQEGQTQALAESGEGYAIPVIRSGNIPHCISIISQRRLASALTNR